MKTRRRDDGPESLKSLLRIHPAPKKKTAAKPEPPQPELTISAAPTPDVLAELPADVGMVESVAVVVDVATIDRLSSFVRPLVDLVLDEDGYRCCAATDCVQRFKPGKGSSSLYYCSWQCAWATMVRRFGLQLPARTAPTKSEIAADPELAVTVKGPWRDVGATLQTYGRSRRVVLKDCGHEVTVKLKRNRIRCRKCRRESEKKTAVAS